MYTITATFSSPLSQADLVSTIQDAYESGGVAGAFTISIVQHGVYEAKFDREAGDDAELLIDRLPRTYLLDREPERLVAQAAFIQLKRELEQADRTEGFIGLLEELESGKAKVSEGGETLLSTVNHHAERLLTLAA